MFCALRQVEFTGGRLDQWKHGLFATSFTRSYVVSRVCNDEMISHILGKLIMGRDLQCELSFSAAHAMTKYEV